MAIRFDFSKIDGKIKPINGMNNGPTGRMTVRGPSKFFELYKALEIPYARNHDASFYTGYGGEHTVDVHRIFKNFDADENDPKNYTFAPTDNYNENIIAAGTKVFYRLGASIEHGFKYGTYPPKDFAKWARICEHIIRHYTEGWADGFKQDIEYWEIWNEPDCHNRDGSNPCWQGTDEQFIDFYEIVAKHLKSCFPHLKIGGPAFCSAIRTDRRQNFLNEIKKRNIPFDFYSFHGYLTDPSFVYELSDSAMASLAEAGIDWRPELIYNEWNYVRSWVGPEYNYSRDQSRKIKGASLCLGTMCVGQESEIDMLMYYDARPTLHWNGLFNLYDFSPFKTYYAYYMIKDVRALGGYVRAESKEKDIYACASTDGGEAAIILTHYNDDDSTASKTVEIEVSNLPAERVLAEYYLTSEDCNAELVRTEVINSKDASLLVKLDLFDCLMIKFKPV